MRNHPELQTYLQDHPELSALAKARSECLRMHQEDRYDRGQDADQQSRVIAIATIAVATVNREELSHYDQFLDTHRETAAQLSQGCTSTGR